MSLGHHPGRGRRPRHKKSEMTPPEFFRMGVWAGVTRSPPPAGTEGPGRKNLRRPLGFGFWGLRPPGAGSSTPYGQPLRYRYQKFYIPKIEQLLFFLTSNVNKNKKMHNGYFLLRKKSGARVLDFGVSDHPRLDRVRLMDNRYVTGDKI